MNVELIKKEMQSEAAWSGGTTTQLMIYPECSEYKRLKFQFRISTAVCNEETSIFTSLPGVKRILMVLAGELTLTHKNHHKAVLKPFEQDTFYGDWETVSTGKCTDFNLMLRDGCTGSLQKRMLHAGEELPVKSAEKTCFYLFDGKAEIHCSNQKWRLEKGDFIMVTSDSYEAGELILRSVSGYSIAIQADIERTS